MAEAKINLNPDISDIKNVSYANLVRSARLSSGHTYRYVFSAPFGSKPTLLFLHGWPESSYSFVNQIDYFSRHGYGLVVPDLLGTGGTDNPKDLESFTWKRMAHEICELLDYEGLDQVVGVSHDLGSPLLSRIQHYSPDRLSAIVFLDVGYTPPGVDMNSGVITAINDLTRKTLGHPVCEFWNFNARDDAGSITDQHLDSLYSLVYHTDDVYAVHLTEVGAFERWLRSGNMAPFHGDFISDVTLAQWRAIVQAQGGSDGHYNWYRAMMRGLNAADEKVLGEDPSLAHVDKPSLIVVADKDPFAVPSIQLKNTTPFFSNLTVRTVNAGHFVHTEAAPEVNRHLHEFFKSLER